MNKRVGVLAFAQKGFTIVELLIVIVVIGILAALVISTTSGVQGRSKDAYIKNDIRILSKELENYRAEKGTSLSLRLS